MVLYRLASEEDPESPTMLLPPKIPGNRASTISSSGSSFMSLDPDSKYPASDSAFPTSTPRGLVPYAYDPALDELDPIDDEDLLHDPGEGQKSRLRTHAFPWRGLMNVVVLVGLILGLLCLFVFYPVLTFFRDEGRNAKIDGNIRINATGQAPVLFQMPDLIDNETPSDARTRTGYDGMEYDLVFSDEFNQEGRTFWPGESRRLPLRLFFLRLLSAFSFELASSFSLPALFSKFSSFLRLGFLLFEFLAPFITPRLWFCSLMTSPRRRPLLGSSRSLVRRNRRYGVVRPRTNHHTEWKSRYHDGFDGDRGSWVDPW
jgi:hypothetical protein